jgi:tetratricopeptide (TPR) repeat protein
LAVQTGDFASAQKKIEQASNLFECIQCKKGVLKCLEGFAELHQTQGQLQQAEEYWQKAADKYNELAMPLRAEKCLEQLRQLKKQE